MAFPSTRQSSLAASAPAWEAIARGDDKALAQSDFDASATRGGDQTMLHYACEHDSHTCAQWILDQPGVDANMQDAQLRTPFLLACENRALKTVGVLMAHKDVDLKAVNKQEQGALHMLASSDEAVATIGALLDKGLDASAISSDALTPLHVAVAHDAVGVARLLLDRGCAEWGTGAGKRAQPLLPIALAKNSAACAALLIERCAPLGGADTEGRTVVHLAVKMGAPCLPAILQRKGELDLDARDRAGRAALHYAVATGSAERAALLLEHGAAIDAEDGAGMTPLHVACCTGEPELAAQLVAKGARVDAADGAGNTPLHWACQRGSEACAKLLLANNANADCPNEAGLTPLVLATSAAMACIFADIESDAEAGGGALKRKRVSFDETGGAPPCVDAFVKAFNGGGAEAMASLFAPAGSLDNGSGIAVGKEAVLKKLGEVLGGAGARFAVSSRHYSPSTLTAAIEGRVTLGKGAAKDTVALLTSDAQGLITKAKLYAVEHL